MEFGIFVAASFPPTLSSPLYSLSSCAHRHLVDALQAVCASPCGSERSSVQTMQTRTLFPLSPTPHLFCIIRYHDICFPPPLISFSLLLIILRSGVRQSSVVNYVMSTHACTKRSGLLFLSNICPEGKEGYNRRP